MVWTEGGNDEITFAVTGADGRGSGRRLFHVERGTAARRGPVDAGNLAGAVWRRKCPFCCGSRDTLRRPLTETEQQDAAQTDRSYSRTQESEISQQFPRLPNPDMVMYVFPHLAEGNSPVPGYSTVFSFYSQTQYAMPGERTAAF